MSRSYSNFLVFEDVLDNLPTDSPLMTQAVSLLLNPMVTIVEENCGTLLGRQVEASLELEGYIETATGDPLTFTRMTQLLSMGTYRYGIRSLDTCVSHRLGGVCRKCYQSSFIGETVPEVGKIVAIPASVIYQTDIVVGTGLTNTFALSQTSDDWYSVKVIRNGILLAPNQYTLGEDSITFPSNVTGAYTVHFLKQNTEPLLGYMARSYSGALLGLQPLPTIKPILRPSLYEAQFSDSHVDLIMRELGKYDAIPSTYIDYVDKIASRLEKVLITLYLFALYSNVETN